MPIATVVLPPEPPPPGATLSHMEIGVRDLRNRTAEVIAAVESGERVTLLNRGVPVADIVPHVQRRRWLPGPWAQEQLRTRQADPGLRAELDEGLDHTLREW